MRVSAIIEARMGSSRLPGKVMEKICDWPMLGLMLERVAMSDLVDTIVVATPEGFDNRPIWDFVNSGDGRMKLSRGPEDDVLSRVLKAARTTKTDVIVELTGDCPLIDPSIIDQCAGYFICGQWDFVGNVKPPTWPKGMDVRVFSTDTLAKVDKEVKGNEREAYWREHVSPWIYDRADTPYNCLNIEAEEQLTYPEINLSVDTREDLRRVKDIFETLRKGDPRFGIKATLEYLASLPGYESLTAPHIFKQASWMEEVHNA